MTWPSEAPNGTWTAQHAKGWGNQARPILQMEKLRASWWNMRKAPVVLGACNSCKVFKAEKRHSP